MSKKFQAGQALFLVQIRWYDEGGDKAIPVEVISHENPEGEWNLYVLHSEYGHPVYVRALDCFETEAELREEVARRRAAEEAKEEAWAERFMAEVFGEEWAQP